MAKKMRDAFGSALFGLALSFTALISPFAEASDYYVSPSGSDSSDCKSIPTACATPNGALALAVTPGDIVNILPGKVYGGGTGTTPPINLTASGSGPSLYAGVPCSSPITIQGYQLSTDRPVIAAVKGSVAAIYGSGVSCIVIQHLEIAGYNEDLSWQAVSQNVALPGSSWQNPIFDAGGIKIGGSLGNPAHNIWISDVSVHDFPLDGIGLSYSDYVTVTNSVVYNNGLYSGYQGSCISLYILQSLSSDTSQGAHNLVAGNKVLNCINLVPNRGLGGSTPLIGMVTQGDTPSGSTTITMNAPPLAVSYGMALNDPVGGCLPPRSVIQYITGSTITMGLPTTCDIPSGAAVNSGYMTDGEGITIDDSECDQAPGCTTPYQARTEISNNVSVNNGGPGIQCAPNSKNCDVYFNTLYYDENAPYRWYITTSPSQINFRGCSGCNSYYNAVVSGNNAPLIYNDCATACAFGGNLTFGGVSGNYGQSIPGSGNVSADPLFFNPGIGIGSDWHLKVGSPALAAAGTNYTRTADIYGATPPSLGSDAIGAATVPICGTVISPLVFCSLPSFVAVSGSGAPSGASVGARTYGPGSLR